MSDEIDWLSERMEPAEVAALLGISVRTLSNRRSARTGPRFYRPAAGKVFYLKRDVSSWLLANPVQCSATKRE